MKELEKEIFEFIENKDNKDYYYKGILFEVFYEYKFRYENYEDYKEDIPKNC